MAHAQQEWVETTLGRMSLNDKAAQLMMAEVPARADKANKRLVRDLAKRLHVGALYFTQGIAEEQALLTNLAQESASVPLIMGCDDAFPGYLEGAPSFPDKWARACMTDSSLIAAYDQQIEQLQKELGALPLTPELPLQRTRNAQRDIELLLNRIQTGELSEAQLDSMCRIVLGYKARHGLTHEVPEVQVSGKSFRMRPDAAIDLAKQMRKEAVTVLHNYFNLLPFDTAPTDMALLSIGTPGADDTFAQTLQAQRPADRLQLTWEADTTTQAQVMEQLARYKRVVVSVTTPQLLTKNDIRFISRLRLPAPVVYVFFTPARLIRQLTPVLYASSAVVVAHSAEPDLQEHTARLLTGQATATGRISLSLAPQCQAGTGVDIVAGSQGATSVPEDHGMKSYVLQRLDALAQKGVDVHAYPGCRLLVLKDGQTIYDRGFGTHSPTDSTAVRATDLFDVAELTQPLGTLLAIMKLYDQGRLQLDDRVSAYVPQLRGTNKSSLTIRQLLLHESGLQPHVRFYLDFIDPNSVQGPYSQSWKDANHQTRVSEHGYYCSNFKFKSNLVSPRRTATHTLQMADGIWVSHHAPANLMRSLIQSELGRTGFVRSELGFLLLQQVVENISGTRLDLYLAKEFYGPMGLKHTGFNPLQRFGRQEIMPTNANDFLRRQDLCGYVQNETAACLGGVAGHAGLFSTTHEIGALVTMLMDGGLWKGKRYLSTKTCSLFTTEQSAKSRHGLGLDRPDTRRPKFSPCAPQLSAEAFGYRGFTGTQFWADPANHLVFVFLSNRLCPNGWSTLLDDMQLCKQMQEVIWATE